MKPDWKQGVRLLTTGTAGLTLILLSIASLWAMSEPPHVSNLPEDAARWQGGGGSAGGSIGFVTVPVPGTAPPSVAGPGPRHGGPKPPPSDAPEGPALPGLQTKPPGSEARPFKPGRTVIE